MALPGELSGLEGVICDCGEHLDLDVYRSGAGYYVGYFCPMCGPYSRETDYFRNKDSAATALEVIKRTKQHQSLRNTEFVPGEFIIIPLDEGE